MGESICRNQDELGWGRSVVENLARDLQAEFPGRNGFSAQNIWLMRQFYLEYRDKPDLAPLVREMSWAKNRVILGRCKDDLAREYFIDLLLFHRRSASSSAEAPRRPSSSTRCVLRRDRSVWRPTPSCRNCRRTTGRICQARSRSPSGSGLGMGLGAGIDGSPPGRRRWVPELVGDRSSAIQRAMGSSRVYLRSLNRGNFAINRRSSCAMAPKNHDFATACAGASGCASNNHTSHPAETSGRVTPILCSQVSRIDPRAIVRLQKKRGHCGPRVDPTARSCRGSDPSTGWGRTAIQSRGIDGRLSPLRGPQKAKMIAQL